MKKNILAVLLGLIAAFNPYVAKAADYKLDVQDFTELKVTDNINVEYHCSNDSAGWAYLG